MELLTIALSSFLNTEHLIGKVYGNFAPNVHACMHMLINHRFRLFPKNLEVLLVVLVKQ